MMTKALHTSRYGLFGVLLIMVLIFAACGGGGGGGEAEEEGGGEATEEESGGEEEGEAEDGEEEGGEMEEEGSEAGGGVGDAEAGEELFNQQVIEGQAGCVTCHYVEADRGDFTGPNQAAVATVAGDRVEGQSAEEYLRTSIVNTNEYIVEGFSADVMPTAYGDVLSEEQVNDLVAYLLTLEG